MHYVGVAWSTGAQFDASWDRNQRFSFPLGKGHVIKGWDEGVAGMAVGGRRRITIPPHLGYGAQGAGGVIKGGETPRLRRRPPRRALILLVPHEQNAAGPSTITATSPAPEERTAQADRAEPDRAEDRAGHGERGTATHPVPDESRGEHADDGERPTEPEEGGRDVVGRRLVAAPQAAGADLHQDEQQQAARCQDCARRETGDGGQDHLPRRGWTGPR